MQKLWLGLVGASMLAGCTFEDGEGFATLESATFSARFEPGPARDAGEGAILTSLGYRVVLSELSLEAGVIELLALQGASDPGAAFDPADPPPGYSLCHGGHCHADDGRLVDYADIEAELAGGAARFEPLVTLPVARRVDVLARPSLALDQVLPSRELPQANVSKLSLEVGALEIAGEVSGGALGAATASLVVSLDAGAVIGTGFPLVIDRDEPGAFSLSTALELDATLLDGVELATGVVDSRIAITDPEAPAAIALTSWLLRGSLGASIH
jgi:hypothetical protein